MKKETVQIGAQPETAGCSETDAQGKTTVRTMGLNVERVGIAGCLEIDAQEENADHKMPGKGSAPNPEDLWPPISIPFKANPSGGI